MKAEEFLNIVSSLKPDRHIMGGRRGSEQNVKVKFVIPLLQYLGYDVTEEMDFEIHGVDIRVRLPDGSVAGPQCRNELVVECKAWEELLTDHLAQCLEYSLKLRSPLVLVSSGRATALYSTLLEAHELGRSEPLFEFGFADLLRRDGAALLSELYGLIGKDAMRHGAAKLRDAVARGLGNVSLEQAHQLFGKACDAFRPHVKLSKLMDRELDELAARHGPAICKALLELKTAIKHMELQNRALRIRYRSKGIGLHYLNASTPRPKILGLFGVYPGDAHVAFGLEHWATLGLSEKTLGQLRSWPRSVSDMTQARKLVALVQRALREIERR